MFVIFSPEDILWAKWNILVNEVVICKTVYFESRMYESRARYFKPRINRGHTTVSRGPAVQISLLGEGERSVLKCEFL